MDFDADFANDPFFGETVELFQRTVSKGNVQAVVFRRDGATATAKPQRGREEAVRMFDIEIQVSKAACPTVDLGGTAFRLPNTFGEIKTLPVLAILNADGDAWKLGLGG